MGSDPASFMENLFLYHCENKELLDTKKRELRIKHVFLVNAFRFIADLCAINDNLECDRNRNIYHSELQLRKTCHLRNHYFYTFLS